MSSKYVRMCVLTTVIVSAFSAAAHAADGVIEINQARALAGGVSPGDTPGFPVTISRSGSYRLTGNLDFTGFAGIVLTAPHVTIDLNGFVIEVSGPGTCGICDPDSQGATTIINGTVVVYGGGYGVKVAGGSRVEAVNMTSYNQTGSVVGISVGGAGIVTRCIVKGPTVGIAVSGGLVSHNEVTAGNIALQMSAPTGFVGNSLAAPTFVSGGIQLGPNICGAGVCP
jgi:hypothetical protein